MCQQLQPPGVQIVTAAAELTTYEKHQRYVAPAPDAQFYHEAPESSTLYSADETEAAVPRPALAFA